MLHIGVSLHQRGDWFLLLIVSQNKEFLDQTPGREDVDNPETNNRMRLRNVDLAKSAGRPRRPRAVDSFQKPRAARWRGLLGRAARGAAERWACWGGLPEPLLGLLGVPEAVLGSGLALSVRVWCARSAVFVPGLFLDLRCWCGMAESSIYPELVWASVSACLRGFGARALSDTCRR